MSQLADFIGRAAPPGSMRYFALQYAPPAQRDVLAALFVVEAEIRASADAAHEVAHTRLQWWRGEIDRLVNRNAQHPATLVLQASLPEIEFSGLHELLVAADMDLARMTYQTARELNAYLDRSGGAIFALTAASGARAHARSIGALIRRVETLRDVATDIRSGRVYWPLDDLAAHDIPAERLHEPAHHDKLRTLIAAETSRVTEALASIALTDHPHFRSIAVLGALYAKLGMRIADSSHDVFSIRHELGPWEKVWTSWRAARRA